LHEFNFTYFAEDKNQNIWKLNQFQPKDSIKIYAPVLKRFYNLPEYIGEAAFDQLPEEEFRMYSIDQILYFDYINEGALWRYDGELTQISQSDDFVLNRGHVSQVPAPEGLMWRITSRNGVYLLDSLGNAVMHYPKLSKRDLRSLYLLEDFSLLYYDSTFNFKVLRPETGTFEGISAPQRLFPRFRNTYALHYNHSRAHQIAGMPDFLLDSRGLRMHLVQKGKNSRTDLFERIEAISPTLKKLKIAQSKRHDKYASLELQNGSVLVPLNGGGLLLLDIQPNFFDNALKDQSIRAISAHDQLLYASNNVGIITEIDLNNKAEREFRSVQRFKNYNIVYTVLSAQADGLWYGGSYRTGGRYGYADEAHQVFLPVTQKRDGLMKAIHLLSDDEVWFGGPTGLYQYQLSTGDIKHTLTDRAVYCLFEDQLGTQWAGTSAGLYNFRTKRYYLDTLANGSPLKVTHIYEQDPKTFWLATHQGLIRWKLDTEEYQQFGIEEGLSDLILHAIYPDKLGRLWISSNNGVMTFDLKTNEVHTYFEEDGLCHSEQNQIAHARDANGRLYFGSINGVNSFHPDSIPRKKDSLDYSLFVSNLQLYGDNGKRLSKKPVALHTTEPIQLSRSCVQLSMELSLPFFEWNEELVVDWRITQRNRQWRSTSDDGDFFLLSLPYGAFGIEFRVRSIRTEKILANYQVHFFNRYPIYYSFLFWVIVFLLFDLLLYGIYRWRSSMIRARNKLLAKQVKERTRELELKTKKLAKVDAAKNQLFNNISHELRTPLNIIQLTAERLAKENSPASEKKVKKIKSQVSRMSIMLEEVMDLNKLDLGVLQVTRQPTEWISFLKQTFNMFESLAREKGLDYQLRIIPEETIYLQLDRKLLEHILYNLIGNAIKIHPQRGPHSDTV
jgi:signal transduction histidine kinase